VFDQRRIGARYFEHDVREFLNRMMMSAANVIGFTRFEVVANVSGCALVGKKSRRAMVARNTVKGWPVNAQYRKRQLTERYGR
jgi:hypothetical protein